MRLITKVLLLALLFAVFLVRNTLNQGDVQTPIGGLEDDGGPCVDQNYDVRIFSVSPLVLYLSNFVNEHESNYLIQKGEESFAPSQRVDFKNGVAGGVDRSFRSSETAFLKPDHVTRCIEQRAIKLQGHVKSPRVEPLQVVRYVLNDYVNNHYDWFDEETVIRLQRFGRRDTTIFAYLHANCTGGGTNFPRLTRPLDNGWCDIIECEQPVGKGVTFKPISGNAVFWHNWWPNGTARRDTLHSGQPVTSGSKIGLNLWTSNG